MATDAASSSHVELEHLASNLAETLVQQASQKAAQVLFQSELNAVTQQQEQVPTVQPLSLDQLTELAQDESIIQALIDAQQSEEGTAELGEPGKQQPQRIVLQEESTVMQQPGQAGHQTGMVQPQQVQVVQPVQQQQGMQVQQHQVRIVQPQGIPRAQQQVQQVKTVQQQHQVRTVQQQVRVVQPGQQQTRFQTQKVTIVQQPGQQQGQQVRPAQQQIQMQPTLQQPGVVRVQTSTVQMQQQPIVHQKQITVQQATVQHKKGPAPQPPPKPTSPTAKQPQIQPYVQQIAVHSPVLDNQQPAMQQPVTIQQHQPAVQQQIAVHSPVLHNQQPAMEQPVAIQQHQPAMQQPVKQPVSVEQPASLQQPVSVQQSFVQQPPPHVPEGVAVQQPKLEQEQPSARQPVVEEQIVEEKKTPAQQPPISQQPILAETTPIAQAAQPPQSATAPPGGEHVGSVSTRRPLVAPISQTQVVQPGQYKMHVETTKPKQLFPERWDILFFSIFRKNHFHLNAFQSMGRCRELTFLAYSFLDLALMNVSFDIRYGSTF